MAIDAVNAQRLTFLVGTRIFRVWQDLTAVIEENFDLPCLWGTGGKKGI